MMLLKLGMVVVILNMIQFKYHPHPHQSSPGWIISHGLSVPGSKEKGHQNSLAAATAKLGKKRGE